MSPALDTVTAVKKKRTFNTEPATQAPIPQEEDFDEMFDEPAEHTTPAAVFIIWGLILLVGMATIVIAYKFLTPGLNTFLSVNTPTPSLATPDITPTPEATMPSPTPAPTATPEATVAPITVRVLNGTKVTGAAAQAKTLLEKNGYSVRAIGNASSQAYATTTLYYQKGYETQADALKTILSTAHTVILQESNLAKPDMLLVVIGKK